MISSRENTLSALSQILAEYNWLLNSYNVDYFLNNHWDRIPKTWSTCLEQFDKHHIPQLLCPSEKINYIFPLSLLCLRALSFLIRNRRAQISDEKLPFINETNGVNHNLNLLFSKDLKWPKKPLRASDHILCRGIKLKKRHEIHQLCKVIPPVMKLSNDCSQIIDCGSGQGHLSRILTLCHGYRMHCIEANCDHLTGAIDRDTKVLNALRKFNLSQKSLEDMPSKTNCFVTNQDQIEKLIDKEDSVGQHLLLGLHACGVLSNLILEQFVNNPNSVGLVLACCCYMKSDLSRFPMSMFLKETIPFELSIEAKELACHAFEKFLDKFNKNELNSLKVHGYRSCLELLIDKYKPTKRHSTMRSVKINSEMIFKEYVAKATRDLDINIPDDVFDSFLVTNCLEQIDRVIIFYSLRLLVAPIVEYFILLDYQQYLSEHCQVKNTYLLSVFDPLLSPRNSILIAHK